MKTKLLLLFLITSQSFCQNYSDFEIYSRKDSLSNYLIAHNRTPSSLTLKILDKHTNEIYQKHIIRPKDSLAFLRQIRVDSEAYLQEIKSKYRLSYHFGDSLSSKHNDSYLYDFPFKKRRRYELIQSWGGSFSHSKPKSYYALDFKMNIGQPVHAARSGIVVRSIERFTKNGGVELRNFANEIIVKHEDNTFAHYVHLRPNGSAVEVGQQVKKGELIGFSGNTGFSTQPHLHFVVRDGSGNSIPIYFKGHKNKKLKTNKNYKK